MKKIYILLICLINGLILNAQTYSIINTTNIINPQNLSDPWGTGNTSFFSNPTSSITIAYDQVVELKKFGLLPYNISYMCTGTIALQSAPSPLGPWTNISISSCSAQNMGGFYVNVYTLTQPKTSQYWKIIHSNYNGPEIGGWTCSHLYFDAQPNLIKLTRLARH